MTTNQPPFEWGNNLDLETVETADDAGRDAVSVDVSYLDWDDAEYPGLPKTRSGYLTTNHPQSSYGIPVLVLHESNLGPAGVRGTGDLPNEASIRVRMDDMSSDLVQRAIVAGYPITDDPVIRRHA